MTDGFQHVLENCFAPEYMEVALEHVREWFKAPNCREDVLKFIEETAHLTGRAIVVLTKERISLLTNSEGGLLEFA
jgi:hypothetical protein